MPALSVVPIFFRVLHILSAVTLLGGAIAWRFAAMPAEGALAADARSKVANAAAAAWRPWVITAVLCLVASGIYNFLHKTGVTPVYHAIFGIKVLLALDVIAALILATRPNDEKRSRKLTRVVIEGFVIVILSAVLRALTLR